MTITNIEAIINAQISDLEKALQCEYLLAEMREAPLLTNMKRNDQDRIKGCEFAIIELNILLNTFKQAA